MVGTVFTYERGFDTLIADVNALGRPVLLLVFGDKSRRGMESTLGRIRAGDSVRVAFMPFIDQHDYDTLLCCTDFNIVRGEDSLARAALSGRPFIWNAYIQDDRYQLVKVMALLETMRPFYGGGDDGVFASYGELMLKFNGAPSESPEQATFERYGDFFKNLEKHCHIAKDIYYFMVNNCNLVAKFSEFLNNN